MIRLLMVFSENCASRSRQSSPRDLQLYSSTKNIASFEFHQFSFVPRSHLVVAIDPWFSHIAAHTAAQKYHHCVKQSIGQVAPSRLGSFLCSVWQSLQSGPLHDRVVCKEMRKPTQRSLRAMKRLPWYLIGALVHSTFFGSSSVGCVPGVKLSRRCSRSQIPVRKSNHVRQTRNQNLAWSKNQATVALSSSEADFYSEQFSRRSFEVFAERYGCG